MYRLCRFFVSDITAGENLLRNGFVPIFRESGLADHGVLFAANGTCKTTLLSFILNVFCPDQRRFVQHLQSSGDKTLEQYLIPGRPAVVLLDLATPLQPTLFESEPMEHLVLGQLLYRHRSAPDKMDRGYFIARSADFFDAVRHQWDGLLNGDQPYKRVKDFIAPHVQQTTSQKEWADNLTRLGLDPWLIDRQVDFARTEGGIKDVFKFRGESEFLSFFLGCVADMEAAATLRDTIGQSLRKMEDRPRKIAQLQSVRALKAKISEFDGLARQWREAREAVAAWQARLGEAAHLLAEADRAVQRKLAILRPYLDAAETERRQAATRMETAGANRLVVLCFQLGQVMATAEDALKSVEAELARHQLEETALKAADKLSAVRGQRAEARLKREILLQADAEMTPVLRRAEALAARYHVRHADDRRRVQEEIAALRLREQEQEETRRDIEEQQREATAQIHHLDEKAARLDADIQAAEAGRTALELEEDESPAMARNRLEEEIAAVEARIAAARRIASDLEEEIRAEEDRWRQLHTDRADRAIGLERDMQRAAAESRARGRLLADPHLLRMAGTPAFEPTAAELVSRLDDAVARGRDRIEEKETRRLALNSELERLGRTETLAADDLVQRLIAHYHQAGVSPGELKSFPEYLAGLYAAPEEVARYLETDPGRFTGLMAATEAVIATVRGLPVPAWLHRPVVISTPCPPEQVAAIGWTVIRPPDPRVYSKDHLGETKGRLEAQREALNQDIADRTAVLRAMENSSRDLHAYRESYPDRAAVTTLADQVKDQEEALAALTRKIEAAEASVRSLRERRTHQEQPERTLTADLTLRTQRLHQVAQWLRRYADLAAWQGERDALARSRSELARRIAAQTETLRAVQEALNRLAGDISGQEMKLKGIDERAGDVPRPQDVSIGEADRAAALSMDLQTLRRLHETAKDDQRRMATELGIDALHKELAAIESALALKEADLEAFRHKHTYDEGMAEALSTRSASDREDRRETLAAAIQAHKESKVRMASDIRYRGEELQRLKKELSEKEQKGIGPDMTEADLNGQDLDSLLERLGSEAARQAEASERLTEDCRNLQVRLKIVEDQQHRIQLGQALTQDFPSLWDERSPRVPWPDLLNEAGNEAGIEALEALRGQVNEMKASQSEDQRAAEALRRKMSGAFDRFQAELQSDAYRHHLPAVIDALRQHDAETLGCQGHELIQRCEDIARNIESDLSISQRIVDNLVEMLLQRGREYHQKLQAAAQVTLPGDVFIYGGKPILRAGTRLDFTKHGDVFRQSAENWLHELIQHNRLPEVNPRAGNCLGAELLYQLLGAASARKEFGIRLLKCDDTGRNYEPVGKDLGSGGEALTTAVLLYALLISMRKKRRSQDDGRIPAFLVLDNPLGVCNRSDFLDAQLKVARAMGIQCVYLTGINDRESLDLFELRVAIRKAEKKLEIDSIAYDCLEITQLNVEKRRGPSAA